MKTTTLMVIVGLSLCLLLAACGQPAAKDAKPSTPATTTQPSDGAVSDADIDSSAQSIDQSAVDSTGVDSMGSDFDTIDAAEY